PLPPGARSGGGRPRGQMWGPARRRRRGGTTTRRDGTHAPGLSLPPARMRLKNHRMNYFPLTTVQHAWQERTARAQRTRDRATRSGVRPESRVSARITARPARRRAVVDTGPAAVWGSRAGSGDDLPDRRGSRETVSVDGDVLQDAPGGGGGDQPDS